MNASQMIDLMNRSPFAPLEIHLNDGNSIRVEEPFQIATLRNSPTCIIYENDSRTRFVAYRNITEVITSTVNGS
ncbi:MAG TPA: hypothetical protein VGI75_05040 [Pirellulales bacterium]